MARRRIKEAAAKSPLDQSLITKAVSMLGTETSVDVRLRLMWWIHATDNSGNQTLWLRLLTDPEAAVRQWAIQLGLEKGLPSRAFLSELVAIAEKETNATVRLALASALQRLPNADRWSLARPLLQHAEDNGDHNLPQMLWYGIEAAVPEQPDSALALARSSKIELPARLVARRLAETQVPATLDLLVGAAAEAANASKALLYLGPVAEALKDRFNLPEPAHWRVTYDAITAILRAQPDNAKNAELQDIRSFLGTAFNDSRAWPELRSLACDRSAALTRRQLALQMLAGAHDSALGELLLALLPETVIRLDVLRLGASLRAQQTTAAESPSTRFFNAVLQGYREFTSEEKSAAVVGLAGRATTALQLLEAVSEKKIPHTDIPAFAARQIAGLNDERLTALLEKVWGVVRTGEKDATTAAAAKEQARMKTVLNPAYLKTASLPQGRLLFKNICGQCHQLFGEGAKIGPDLTGSNRADIDYILENVTNPNAIIGKDYELHVLTLKDGRTVSGMVRQENNTTITVQAFGPEEQVLKTDIKSKEKPGISMMPAGLFAALTSEQMRDLAAYLASPKQAALPGEAAPPAYKVAGALEGETLQIVSSTGSVAPQSMANFKDGVFSGDTQLWWRGGKPGDVLNLTVPVKKAGRYRLKAVFCRAPDYAVVRMYLDKKPLEGAQIDLFGSKVSNTPPITLCEIELAEGNHVLGMEISGANPAARPSYMVGLDCLLLEAL